MVEKALFLRRFDVVGTTMKASESRVAVRDMALSSFLNRVEFSNQSAVLQ
jgi:hypothetical protein